MRKIIDKSAEEKLEKSFAILNLATNLASNLINLILKLEFLFILHPSLNTN